MGSNPHPHYHGVLFSSPDMSLASGLVEHEGELTEEQVIL